MRSFDLYVGTKDPKTIDSKTVIQDFLQEENALYRGNEIILHCLCAVAVKYSVGVTRKQADIMILIDIFQVESSVESLISRYEIHFDRHRQRGEERAAQEMYISEV